MVTDDYEDEDYRNHMAHAEALQDTGFWGHQGAGCLFLAKSTNRILIAHRSDGVLEPETWGSWGGAIDDGESPVEAVLREKVEEAGHDAPCVVIPLLVFQSGSFRYHNHLVVVEDEFEPELNWETQASAWCEFGEWPDPLHFGLETLFADRDSIAAIERAISSSFDAILKDHTATCPVRALARGI